MSERCETCKEPTKYALAAQKNGKTVYGYYCRNTKCPHWAWHSSQKHRQSCS